MTYEPDIGARIKAARTLRGLTREQLSQRLIEQGLTGREAARLQSGTAASVLPIHRFALSRALGVPERWFIVPVDEICPARADPSVTAHLEQIVEMLRSLIERNEG